MLLSITSCSAVSMITSPSLPQYGSAVIVGLIMLLCLKEILSTSERWNRNLNSSFNLVIIPLLLCFTAIVAYMVENIL
jgi:hypothetical protein